MNSPVVLLNQEANARYQAAYTAKMYRSRFPGAPLKVFQLGTFQYMFVVSDPFYAQPEKIAEFNNSIRPATASIELTNAPPSKDAVPVDLEELLKVGGDMSYIHSLVSLENALTIRHPDLAIIGVEQDHKTLALTVVLPADRRDSDLAALRRDLRELPFLETGLQIEFRHDQGAKRRLGNDVFMIVGRQRRPKAIQELQHVREDDERWYSEFSAAAAGRLSASDFPFAPDGQRSVFLPGAEAALLPNLRNYFLLYDRVVLEAPLLENYVELEKRHGLCVDDFAEAAARGRLRLLVTQPEERLPLHLLQAIQERTKGAIIGRRAGSTFAMATYAQRADRLEKLGVSSGSLGFIGHAISQAMKVDRGMIERVLLEPIASRYRALEALRHNDLKALPHDFGRDTWDLVRSLVAGGNLQDLELEFLISGNMVSVANLFESELAIGGTRSPFLFPAHVVSTSYAMYRGPLAPALAQVKDSAIKNNLMVYPEGPLFEFSELRRLGELLDIVGPGQQSEIARSIFTDLAKIPEDERSQRILMINDIMHSYGALPSDQVIGSGMAARYAKIIIDALGPFIPVLGNVASGLELADEVGAWYRDTERMKKLGEDIARSRRQIELLSGVRKVAWLSEKRPRK
jgi:hypothetical protein